MTVDLKFDTHHAVEVIDDLCKSYTTSPSLTKKPTKLLILPDRLSITQLMTYLIKTGYQDVLNDLKLTTFENLAYELLDTDVSIIDNELLKYVIMISIQNMTNTISKKLNRALRNVPEPESSEIVASISSEFGEYSAIISPFFRDSKNVQKTLRILGAKRGGIFSKKSNDVLDFFEELEKTSLQTMDQFGITNDTFLSRAHLVGYAAKKLESQDLSQVECLKNIKEVYVIGIPIFDKTVLDFLTVILDKIKSGHIVAFEGVSKHLQSRLKAIMGNKLPKKINTITSQSIQKKTYKIRLPDRRREIEYAALKVIDLIQPKEKHRISDVLLVSRLSSDYAPYIDSVFQEFGIPTYVQARISMVFSPVFRLIESILKLIVNTETKTSFSASDISMPLRLGYPFRKNPRRAERITDKRYLIIETNLERLQNYHGDGSISTWINRLLDAKKRSTGTNPGWIYDPPLQLLKWIQSLAENSPDIKEIRNLVQRFIDIYGTQKDYLSLGLVPNTRFEITKEHISSEAMRVLRDLKTLQKHMRLMKEARKRLARKQRAKNKWIDLYRSYIGVIGEDTYGQIHRDAEAILFLDAGISHFVKSKTRIILGLTNDQFPRKFPEPFLIYRELRQDLSDVNAGFFINNSEFHHTVEEYLLRTAEGTSNVVYYLMNFLDESGHKQHWSSLVDERKDVQVHAHELRVELSDLLGRNQTSCVSTALFDILYSMRGGNISGFQNTLNNSFQSIMQKGASSEEFEAILTSANAMQEKVIEGKFNPYIGIGSSSILDLVFNSSRIPSIWELDLILYCPAAYYFYTFYHLIPNKGWIERTLNINDFLTYVPLYKLKNKTGPAPTSVWRTLLSNKSVDWLTNVLGIQPRKLTPTQSTNYRQQCQTLEISPAEKGALDELLEYLVTVDKFKLKPPRISNSLNIQIPITLELPNDRNPSKKVQTVPYKLQPIPYFNEAEPFNMTILGDTFTQAIKFRSTRLYYKGFGEDLNNVRKLALDKKEFNSYISSLVQRPSYNEEVCDQCYYHSLCGLWGF